MTFHWYLKLDLNHGLEEAFFLSDLAAHFCYECCTEFGVDFGAFLTTFAYQYDEVSKHAIFMRKMLLDRDGAFELKFLSLIENALQDK